MCWRPNVDQFDARSLEVVAWVKERGVVAGVQSLRQQVLLALCLKDEIGGVTGAAVGSGGGGGGGKSGLDGGVTCGGVCCGGGVYGWVW